MTPKTHQELVESIVSIMFHAWVECEEDDEVTARAILSEVLAALEEPNEAMQIAVSANWGRRTWAEYRQVLAASPLAKEGE